MEFNHIYFTALANGAGLAAALAKGDGRERVYIVEPSEELGETNTSASPSMAARVGRIAKKVISQVFL